MSCYGVIFVGYRCADLLSQSLAPWLAVRERKTGGHTFKIAVVSVPFHGFDNGPEDATHGALQQALVAGEIDHLIAGDTPMTEVEARGQALKWLVEAGADALWQWDADEVSTIAELEGVVRFVEARPMICWFRGSLKNYVHDRQTFLVEPFTPPRIHRVRPGGGLVAVAFEQDNDVSYQTAAGQIVSQHQLASITIPRAVQFTPHFSWLNDERSRRKISYQLNARKWPSCSFAWDDSRGGLVWNEEHFKRTGQPLPEVARD